jgi:hypothetical protein
MNQPFFASGFNSKPPHIKASTTVATSSKSSRIKRTQKESDREANTNSDRNLSKQKS